MSLTDPIDIYGGLISLDPLSMMNIGIGLQTGLSIALLLCSFSAVHTANVGFNILLTAFIFLISSLVTYGVIHIEKSPLTIGIVFGKDVGCIFLSFMTAVFWDQLSVCEKTMIELPQYSCDNKILYRFICLLSAGLFICQIGSTSTILYFQKLLLENSSQYAEIQEYADEDLSPYGKTKQKLTTDL